jgi:hypothetical protein
MSKRYLTLDDLHNLLIKREDEDLVASGAGNHSTERVQTNASTPSLSRNMVYQLAPTEMHRGGLWGDLKLEPRRRSVAKPEHITSRGLPAMYTRQLVRQEDFTIFKDFDDVAQEKGRGHATVVPGGLHQHERIPAVGYDSLTSNPGRPPAPQFNIWTDPVDCFGDEVKTSFFKSSKSGGRTTSCGSPRKDMLPQRQKTEEAGASYGGFLKDTPRRWPVVGVGASVQRTALGMPHGANETARSLLQKAEEEVREELLSKGFWRRQFV